MFSRTQKINLSPIKQIELLASKIPDVVSLAQGVPSFDTPDVVKKAAIKALNKGRVAKYSLTMGIPELRETIEQKLAEDHMFYDFEKEIIATAGSIEAITATFITLIDNKKDEIILFSPSYTSYAEAVKVAGGKPIFVNLLENEGWKIDFKSLEKKINSRTAGILICNPNNPTGTIFPKNDLYRIAELAYKKKFFIITDEVYKDFIYDQQPMTNDQQLFSLAQIPELRKNVIRIFSLSKAYAMTGWRIGFLHSDEEVVREILKVHDSLVTCAPVISQYAAMSALDFGGEEVEKFRKEFEIRRDLICGHLDELSDFFSYQKPNSSYFIFPKLLPKRDSWEMSLDLLEKAHVAVVPGVAFGPSGESHIRMSFGRSEKDINEAFKRIKIYFNS
ncbi:aminotransferase [Candidatus Wolfebacteria bacterium CG10_big_fil_rev_8_21_14_0_10_31_9]|uniref:Aminotransferase n=1 Tax=Candidatus Wolfebacteria bacterium CG10_big_fil_rev_8_21_14_0_10_31_9 TaxID=1975070 RepID=A0A2H0RCD4_9BACT|nr:MAG: aminotransferase [Candidatus Wolfebacteria bacterium CG10_big_fil_rev_8_21_14_0_10_31_9]